jgi:hypothetical protein
MTKYFGEDPISGNLLRNNRPPNARDGFPLMAVLPLNNSAVRQDNVDGNGSQKEDSVGWAHPLSRSFFYVLTLDQQ